jgi:hypothetical protein
MGDLGKRPSWLQNRVANCQQLPPSFTCLGLQKNGSFLLEHESELGEAQEIVLHKANSFQQSGLRFLHTSMVDLLLTILSFPTQSLMK